VPENETETCEYCETDDVPAERCEHCQALCCEAHLELGAHVCMRVVGDDR
jgi:hypothetical protein